MQQVAENESSVGKRARNRFGRSGVGFSGRSNRHIVANGSPHATFLRSCIAQELGRGNELIIFDSYVGSVQNFRQMISISSRIL